MYVSCWYLCSIFFGIYYYCITRVRTFSSIKLFSTLYFHPWYIRDQVRCTPFSRLGIIRLSFLPVSVQFSHSVVSNSLRPHEPQHARPPCPSPKPVSIKLMMPSNHLILCHPLLLLPSVFPSIRVFSNESAL